ncbi:MAG: type II secretion system F family protein [Pirellulales bacterium]|nr:type II secretion system F family protein [Pirellulales bacterium]
MESMVPFAIFGAIGVLAWWVLNLVAGDRSRASERLEAMQNPGLLRDRESKLTKTKGEKVTKAIENAAPAFARPLQSQDQETVDKLKLRLSNAGFRGESASTVFLGLRFITLLIGLGAGAIILLSADVIDKRALIKVVLLAGGLFYLPTLVLMLIARKRQQAIFLGLPDALDLLVVCVEAGLGLDQAMRKVSEEMKKTHPVIAAEFGLANLQLQMGGARNDVLHELGVRTGVADVRSLAGVLIQADKFGSSIAQALRVQSDSMRVRRRQLAEEKAAKTAVKLIFPLVIFIFPGIFVVLVGPAAITMVTEMFPLMDKK